MSKKIIQNQILNTVAKKLTRVESLVEDTKTAPGRETQDNKNLKEKIQKPLFIPIIKIKEDEEINQVQVKKKLLKK